LGYGREGDRSDTETLVSEKMNVNFVLPHDVSVILPIDTSIRPTSSFNRRRSNPVDKSSLIYGSVLSSWHPTPGPQWVHWEQPQPRKFQGGFSIHQMQETKMPGPIQVPLVNSNPEPSLHESSAVIFHVSREIAVSTSECMWLFG
jgi:hypothetical protein